MVKPLERFSSFGLVFVSAIIDSTLLRELFLKAHYWCLRSLFLYRKLSYLVRFLELFRWNVLNPRTALDNWEFILHNNLQNYDDDIDLHKSGIPVSIKKCTPQLHNTGCDVGTRILHVNR